MSFSSVANPDASRRYNPHEETHLEKALREQVETKRTSRTLNIRNCDSLSALQIAMLQCSAKASSLESPRTTAIRKNHKQERHRRTVGKNFTTLLVTQGDSIRSVLEHTSMVNIPTSGAPGQPPATPESVNPRTIIGFDVPRLQTSDPSAGHTVPKDFQSVNKMRLLDDSFYRDLENFSHDMSRGLFVEYYTDR
ncbi:hypothetical protein KP509_31G050300 [Ceratopteris richardii]|uniref:Uncharacterized protein n=1 Tax=Ceratopteris richardii TaxID=49495 RepID=A0A8T2R013_CERRI|nr:hypothetical protein KP509_31G050300 [Ceratopteris richardii]